MVILRTKRPTATTLPSRGTDSSRHWLSCVACRHVWSVLDYCTGELDLGSVSVGWGTRVHIAIQRCAIAAVAVQGRVQRSVRGAVVHLCAQRVVSIDERVEVEQQVYEWT